MIRPTQVNQRFILVLLTAILLCAITVRQVIAQEAIVNAVLFYSPSCPHCQQVIQEDLPPLLEEYGSKLNILGINTSMQQGQELYLAAIERFKIPEEKLGVPCLIVGETVLVGALDIPDQFPGIIEAGLAQGGIPLPDIPGLEEAISASQESGAGTGQPTETPRSPNAVAQGSTTSGSQDQSNQQAQTDQLENDLTMEQPSLMEKFTSDLTGNLFSVIVLIGMIGSVIGVGVGFSKQDNVIGSTWPDWLIPLLAVIGLGIACYLSFVEVTETEAICGPVGNCNAVQQSPYAMLFGVLPVGMLGALGYIGILGVWLVQKLGPHSWRNPAKMLLWILALAGIMFSIYLTFLEPFVIGATCAWCLASAVIMTLIFLAASAPAQLAWKKYSGRGN